MLFAEREIVGDYHNFQRAVERHNFNGLFYFKKPRTLFWEELFFGSNSPIKESFDGTELEKYFCLESCDFNGSKFQKNIPAFEIKEFNFKGFGALIGYCFFGACKIFTVVTLFR